MSPRRAGALIAELRGVAPGGSTPVLTGAEGISQWSVLPGVEPGGWTLPGEGQKGPPGWGAGRALNPDLDGVAGTHPREETCPQMRVHLLHYTHVFLIRDWVRHVPTSCAGPSHMSSCVDFKTTLFLGNCHFQFPPENPKLRDLVPQRSRSRSTRHGRAGPGVSDCKACALSEFRV